MASSSESQRTFPKIKTIQSWKTDFSWLNLESTRMSCKLCCKWKCKLLGVKNYFDAFIKGSSNYCRPNISDHSKSAEHLKSCELEEKQSCEKEGQKYQEKVVNVD